MRHIKNIVVIACIVILKASVFECEGQRGSTYEWADSLNTAKDASYLSQMEREVIFELNKVRTNPQQYVRYIKEERTYYQGYNIEKPGAVTIVTNEGVAAVDDCIEALGQALPTGMLYPDEGLCKAAEYLANDHAQTGLTSHYSSDGASMESRIKKYVRQQFWAAGENISYGACDAREIVTDLLIDDGVPSRGHRTNIMNASYNFCGVAIDSHPIYRHVCVIDFGKFNVIKNKKLNIMRCKNCGWDNSGESVKCEKCNAPLIGSMGVSDSLGQAEHASEEGFNPQSTATGCPSCGYPLRKGIDECPQCGHSLTGSKRLDVSPEGNANEKAPVQKNIYRDSTVIRMATSEGNSSLTGRKIAGFLVTYSHCAEGEVFIVREGRNYVGRDSSADISIQGDAQVSGKHFSILYRVADRKFKFRDEQSSNGTFLNGVLTDEGELNHADVINIGATRLVFVKVPE